MTVFLSITFSFLTKLQKLEKFRSNSLWTVALLLLLCLANQKNEASLTEPVKFCTNLNICSSFQPACANCQIQSPNGHIFYISKYLKDLNLMSVNGAVALVV